MVWKISEDYLKKPKLLYLKNIYIIDDMKKMKWYVICLKLILLFSFLFTFVCIKRNNPWDPINGCPDDYRTEIRRSTIPKLENFISNAQLSYSMLNRQIDTINILNAKNDSIRTLFLTIPKKLDSTYRKNDIIDSINRIDCSMLTHKLKADTFPSFTYITDTVNIRNLRSSITDDSMGSLTQISIDNNECQPHGIYSIEFQDSIHSIFKLISTRADSLITIIKKFNATVTDSNTQVIVQNNIYVKRYNLTIDRYNDSISLVMEYCKTNWISDPQDIKKRIDSLKPGDTLSIDSGMHEIEIRFRDFGDSSKPLIIQGTPFLNTVLHFPNFIISNSRNIIIRNLTFLDSRSRGLPIEDNSSAIRLENCNIINSTDNGLEVLNSIVSVENCTFRENANGILCNGPDARLELKNVLIIKNRGSGIICKNSQLGISKATISDNGNSGIYLTDQRSPLSIVSTLMTHNSPFGLEREPNADMSDVSLYYSVFFGNTSGDFRGDSSKIIVDISCKNADPQYISRELNDYRIGNPELSILGYTP